MWSKPTESYLCFEDKYMNISTPEAKSELLKHKAYIFENETSRQVCVRSSVVFTDIVSKVNRHDYCSIGAACGALVTCIYMV